MKNPYLRALLAGLYIPGIVYVINTITKVAALQQTLLIPISMLGLFVLSAAVMGYLFLAIPLELFLEQRHSEALAFFGKTVGTFAIIVALFLCYILLSFS